MINVDNDNDQPNQKRSLKKVRRSFLTRRGFDNDPTNPDFDTLDSSLDGKLEIEDPVNDSTDQHNRVYIDINFLNPQLNIESVAVENDAQSKIVTFSFESNEDTLLIPWEDTPKKVKIYGDLNLASWSKVFSDYFETFPNIMEKAYKILFSEDKASFAGLRKAALKARITRNEIEREYPYRRFEFFINEHTVRLLTSSFNERFIEKLGFTLEDFTSWIKVHGFPAFFAPDSPINFGTYHDFFESITKKAEYIEEGPDYVVCCKDKDGNNSCFVVQGIYISEPTPEGFFGTAYIILKGKAGEIKLEGDNKPQKMEFENDKTHDVV